MIEVIWEDKCSDGGGEEEDSEQTSPGDRQ